MLIFDSYITPLLYFHWAHYSTELACLICPDFEFFKGPDIKYARPFSCNLRFLKGQAHSVSDPLTFYYVPLFVFYDGFKFCRCSNFDDCCNFTVIVFHAVYVRTSFCKVG